MFACIVLCSLESAIAPSLRHRRVARLDCHRGDIIRALSALKFFILVFIPVVIMIGFALLALYVPDYPMISIVDIVIGHKKVSFFLRF